MDFLNTIYSPYNNLYAQNYNVKETEKLGIKPNSPLSKTHATIEVWFDKNVYDSDVKMDIINELLNQKTSRGLNQKVDVINIEMADKMQATHSQQVKENSKVYQLYIEDVVSEKGKYVIYGNSALGNPSAQTLEVVVKGQDIPSAVDAIYHFLTTGETKKNGVTIRDINKGIHNASIMYREKALDFFLHREEDVVRRSAKEYLKRNHSEDKDLFEIIKGKTVEKIEKPGLHNKVSLDDMVDLLVTIGTNIEEKSTAKKYQQVIDKLLNKLAFTNENKEETLNQLNKMGVAGHQYKLFSELINSSREDAKSESTYVKALHNLNSGFFNSKDQAITMANVINIIMRDNNSEQNRKKLNELISFFSKNKILFEELYSALNKDNLAQTIVNDFEYKKSIEFQEKKKNSYMYSTLNTSLSFKISPKDGFSYLVGVEKYFPNFSLGYTYIGRDEIYSNNYANNNDLNVGKGHELSINFPISLVGTPEKYNDAWIVGTLGLYAAKIDYNYNKYDYSKSGNNTIYRLGIPVQLQINSRVCIPGMKLTGKYYLEFNDKRKYSENRFELYIGINWDVGNIGRKLIE